MVDEDKIIKDEDIVSRKVKRDRRIGADKAVKDNKEEEYLDDEYVKHHNDPHAVEKIEDEEYFVVQDEERVGFDKVFESVKTKMVNLTNYDHMMEEKVLDALRKGKLK